MRKPILALAAALAAGAGSLLGADPIITTLSILVALFRVGHAGLSRQRYDVPQAERVWVYPYRYQFMR